MSTPTPLASPAPLPIAGPGIPTPVAAIDRELKKLWEQSDNVATRASLMNLVVYCEGKETMATQTALIARIAMSHACRAILIVAEPQAPENNVQSWITAHCHLSRAGAKQTCCEQITFLLEGPSRDLIPNIVFSHLDSDLPLFFWWHGEFPDPTDSQLWMWVDRLIYDSQSWRDQCAQLRLLRESLAKSSGRTILCDLNWTRSLYLRQAISSTFDHPDHLAHLEAIGRVEIVHAPGYRSSAQLLAGWLASRLGWTVGTVDDGGAEFARPKGGNAGITWREAAGPTLSACTLSAPEATFEFTREGDSEFLHSHVTLPGGREHRNLFPSGLEEPDALVIEEMERGGRHRVYLDALAIAERLF